MIPKLFCFVYFFLSFNALSSSIAEPSKKDYAADLLKAFEYQSQGESTTASFYFEQGFQKAIKAQESSNKMDAIRQLFTWYRTYGNYLRLMTKDPHIIGEYLGNNQYSQYKHSSCRKHWSSDYQNPQQTARIRSYLYGVTELLGGILCIWLGPGSIKAVGGGLIYSGFDRIFDVLNESKLQNDIAIQELMKARKSAESAACNCPQ